MFYNGNFNFDNSFHRYIFNDFERKVVSVSPRVRHLLDEIEREISIAAEKAALVKAGYIVDFDFDYAENKIRRLVQEAYERYNYQASKMGCKRAQGR